MILVVVLVVISLLSLAALTFSELMLTEREAATLSARRAQARASAQSGVEMARLFVGWDELTQLDQGSWYNNPGLFQGILLVDEAHPRWTARFTMVAPYLENGLPAGIRFGLEDESTRLNLNTLALEALGEEGEARQILMALPGMDEMIADAILDWIDTDDELREFGAEADSYSMLDPPYAPRNGPPLTIEELLLVQGVTPSLLFGVDANRNAYVDQGEPDPQTIGYVDNSTGAMNGGWASYLTLWSLESNLKPDGSPKINLNEEDLEALYDELVAAFDAERATFIIGFRQNGEFDGVVRDPPPPGAQIDFGQSGTGSLTSVLDVLVPKVQVNYEGQNDPVAIESPFGDDPATSTDLPELMDQLTVTAAEAIPGRININQASETVLAGIPGMTSQILTGILSSRLEDPIDAQVDPHRKHATWILPLGIATLEEMKALMPYVCGGGSVYRTQVIGYFDQDGPACRIEVVIDASKQPASVLFWRDMSHLGPGYSLDVLGTGVLQ